MSERPEPARPQRSSPDGERTVPEPLASGGLLTAEQVARRWQVKASQVYRLSRQGALPTVRLGRYFRYRPEALEEFERGGGAADG